MKENIITRTVYIAEDGTEFLTKRECEEYENTTMKVLQYVSYYKIAVEPNLSDGTEYSCVLYLAIYNPRKKYNESHILEYLFGRYKRVISYIRGVEPIPTWGEILPIDKEKYIFALNQFKMNKTKRLYESTPVKIYMNDDLKTYEYVSDVVFLSNKKVYLFPEPLKYTES